MKTTVTWQDVGSPSQPGNYQLRTADAASACCILQAYTLSAGRTEAGGGMNVGGPDWFLADPGPFPRRYSRTSSARDHQHDGLRSNGTTHPSRLREVGTPLANTY